MNTTILAFGIVRELFNGASQKMELPEGATVAALKNRLESDYPEIKKLRSYMVAVNNEYADDSLVLRAQDEIAVIPPVSGG